MAAGDTSTKSADMRAELEAIQTIVDALSRLTGAAQNRVLAYVAQALDLSGDFSVSTRIPATAEATSPVLAGDIRSLKEAKAPRSAIEMAAVVAYYLSEVAPDGDRKDAVRTADLEKYFKQAGFKLPTAPQYTLPNAAAAGYFDSAGHGQYRLNPVGYNLVAYNLPSSGAPRKVATRSRKAGSPKKVSKPLPRQVASAPPKP
jgi:hypothetical protein